MDHAACHVVYVDKRTSKDLEGRYIQKPAAVRSSSAASRQEQPSKAWTSDFLLREIDDVRSNLDSLLGVFDGVHVCNSHESCMAKLTELDSADDLFSPILALVETTVDEDGSPEQAHQPSGADCYGATLLQHISVGKADSQLSKLVIPVAVVRGSKSAGLSNPRGFGSRLFRPSSGGLDRVGKSISSQNDSSTPASSVTEPWKTLRCLESGAIDVLACPLTEGRVANLLVPAYHAKQEAQRERSALLATKRLRKRSWVGFDDQKPYAYLREQMVSGLMTGICDPENEPYTFDLSSLPELDSSRESSIAQAVGSWAFSAHSFSDDELVHAASLMLQHALQLPALEKWRLSTDELRSFLLASRAAYNAFVHYHNFRHVVDVLQAVFYFLLQIGTLPPYPGSPNLPPRERLPPIATLLQPFDALTLLISAIGHDVGHPGVNNAFLVALNAPLAQLYNDKSVLESFHCAAYSQILRRYWRRAFEDASMRSLLINSILATDMGVHFKYMKDVGNLQQKLHDNNGTEGWNLTALEEYKTLTCGLLIKCADISNVARPFGVAAQWADVLQQEFANQGVMEKEVGIESTLFGGPPELGNIVKLANSQNGFMNIFARPLFEAVSDILPSMTFAVNEMKANTEIWTNKIGQEKAKEEGTNIPDDSEGVLSPKSRSPNRSSSHPEASHPEGLPASANPLNPTFSASMQHVEEKGRRSSSDRTLEARQNLDRSSSPFRNSRRSSSGLAAGHGSSLPDPGSYSRRSSGAFSAAQLQNITARRRSSNTSPSQLQIGSSSDPRPSAPSMENAQLYNRESEDTLSQSQNTIVGSSGNEQRGFCGGGGGGDTWHRGTKFNDFRRPSRSSRPSTTSNQRDSSGAHTNMSQSTPYSPTTTQATSILTTNSSEKSSSHRNGSAVEGMAGWSTSPRKSIPDTVDIDRQPSALPKAAEIKTSILSNGTISPTEEREMVVGRKSSRFRLKDLWRKKGRVEASP